MKSYAALQRRPIDYIVAAVVAFLAIGLVVYALTLNKAEKTEPAHPPIQTVIIAEAPPPPPPPPPPHPVMVQPPPPYIPPPRIKLPPPPKPPIHHSAQKVPQPKVAPTSVAPAATSASAASSSSSGSGDSTSDSDHAAGAVPINNVRPEYPEEAQEESREGSVTASCDILTNGKPANCKLLSVKGGHDFAENALNFLEHSPVRYQPAMAGGQPVVEHNHVLHVDFTLGDDE
ncbi:MAG: energy transducer TonB, partial [Bifidobacteriales bacterium]|nr:energy transducer TonB [Bifidobacteriales bacterium]MCT6854846.1 energy transducer TonB [Bombella apis]